MKPKGILFLLLIFAATSCTKLIECEEVQKSHTVFLIDVTDPVLFEEIETDLRNHLPGFMQSTGMAEISSCEQFTLSVIPVTSKETLDVASATISIDRKGQSYQSERAQADPTPLVALLRDRLIEFGELTHDPSVTSGSSIANVLVKAISQAEPGTRTTFLVFSDMIENNQYLNMYREIPDAPDVADLVDPLVLEKFRQRQQQGLDVEIWVVCKASTVRTVNATQRNVKQFWNTFLQGLDLHDIRFMDNLSNTPN